MALGSRRKDVFLATKVLADTIEEAEQSLAKSFELVRTDMFDLVYYHSVGDHDVKKAMDSGGVFDWLLKQKKAGKFQFLGISGHHKPAEFVPLLESGEVDVLLTVVNFVDRHTYNFEEQVLPAARKHNAGIVAMKVFGGARRSAGSYELVLSPVLLGLVGYLLDRWFGTLPLLTVVFAAVAFLGACVKLYYGYKQDMDEHDRGRPWAKS